MLFKKFNVSPLHTLLLPLSVRQCEVVTSLKALHRFIDCSQLTAEFDGPFPYNPSDWIRFRRVS